MRKCETVMSEGPFSFSMDAMDQEVILRRQRAESPEASREELAMLMTDSHMSVRRQAALHPNASQELLQLLQQLGANSNLSAMVSGDPELNTEVIDGLLSLGPWVSHLAARHPNTSTGQLRQIYSNADRSVKIALAQHSNADEQLLGLLCLDQDENVREMAFKHPGISMELMEDIQALEQGKPVSSPMRFDQFASSESLYARCMLARHPSLSTENFERFLSSKEWKLRQSLLENHALSSEQLSRVVKTLPMELLETLAFHPQATSTLLDQLSETKDMGIKIQLATHPHTSSALLIQLMEDGSFMVRMKAAMHPMAPKDHLELLARAGSSPDLQAMAKSDLSLGPAEIKQLAGGGHWAIQLICVHPNTPSSVLRDFVADAHFLIREQISQHPNRPEELIALMVKAGSSEDLQEIKHADQPLSEEELKLLLDLGPWARRLLSRHPQCPQSMIMDLISDEDWQIRRILARRQDLPEAARVILAEDEAVEVRWSLLKNKSVSQEIMLTLARDEMAQIRLSVLDHPQVTVEVLNLLQWDMDEEVRTMARELLDQLKQ